MRGAISASNQRISDAGTKCSVPRMNHVRTIVLSAMARSPALALACLMRMPMAHSAAR